MTLVLEFKHLDKSDESQSADNEVTEYSKGLSDSVDKVVGEITSPDVGETVFKSQGMGLQIVLSIKLLMFLWNFYNIPGSEMIRDPELLLVYSI